MITYIFWKDMLGENGLDDADVNLGLILIMLGISIGTMAMDIVLFPVEIIAFALHYLIKKRRNKKNV